MPEDVRMWTEIAFNVVYLIAVWSLVTLMWRNRENVTPGNRRVAELTLWAFALLAIGDTGHVGFRVVAYATGGLETTYSVGEMQIGLVGLGALATAITVTGFYVLMLYAWRQRFDKEFGWFEYLLLIAAVVRLVIMSVPGNDWNSAVPPQPMSILRNLPLTLLGLGVAYLYVRDVRAVNDRPFFWMGMMILVSYACYIPVILFVQQAPIVGMLMIPKTLAYLAIAVIAYRNLYEHIQWQSTVVDGVGDA